MKNKELIKQKILEIGNKKNIKTVFEDFVICAAYAISNSVYYDQSKEDQYLAISSKYQNEDLDGFAEMIAYLTLEYAKENPRDILGELYEEFGLFNSINRQYFTPEHLCNIMTQITLENIDVNNTIKKKGYISINDPACGSGRTLLSALKYLEKKGIDLDCVFVEGDDVSLFCACMTYLNLSLYGASGVVKHQDTLTQKVYSVFYTPQYVYNKKLHENMQDKSGIEEIPLA